MDPVTSVLPRLGVIALVAPLLPAMVFAVLGTLMLVHRPPRDRIASRMVSLAFTASLLAALFVASSFLSQRQKPIVVELGSWFHTRGYAFEASLLVDGLSAPMMVITAALCGLIGRFSSTYLAREPGQPRFYLLLSLFATGMFLLVMAGSLDLLIAGWELVGLSSMLLIGFFHERTFAARNALRAFVVYRACDMGLLTGTVLMHHYAHTGAFAQAFGLDAWPAGDVHFGAGGAALIALSLLWASAGKSALFPVGSWLPRAMEGPTPSSAIFYGALSVHAGAYLMLRVTPLLEASTLAAAVVVTVGVLTAVHGTLVQRVQTDVKSQLAYATTTQVGVIFVEIGLGFARLALLHLVSHALLRTLQLLRAPNAIHDAALIRAAAGTHHMATGQQFARLEPSPLAHRLYHFSLERFHLDSFWESALARPLLAMAHGIEALEERWLKLLSRGVDDTPKAPHGPGVTPSESGRAP